MSISQDDLTYWFNYYLGAADNQLDRIWLTYEEKCELLNKVNELSEKIKNIEVD